MSRPRIGLNCDLAQDGLSLSLNDAYVQGIVRAGGSPVVLPPVSDLECIGEALDALHGLVLVGGRDYDPVSYGCERHREARLLHPRRDRFDRELAASAIQRSLPILGVCGGAQLLNIVRGGSLVQDIAEELGSPVEHRKPGEAEQFHPVRVEPGSRLARTLGACEVEVNTSHHQAVQRVGQGLRAVAWAPDGVVEAVEGAEESFLLGVQWHPERLLERAEQAALFEALVGAARRVQGVGC